MKVTNPANAPLFDKDVADVHPFTLAMGLCGGAPSHLRVFTLPWEDVKKDTSTPTGLNKNTAKCATPSG